MKPAPTRILWLFLGLFLVLGLGYSSFTPIFEQSDETLHYPYVKHLADGLGLPLARPGELWNQEGTQPPLYYAIVAASTFWIDSTNLADHLQRNPHWLFTEVRALINDNQNLVLHGPADTFPYRQAALAIHIGRWWSLAFGLVAVAVTFLIGRNLFPDNLPLTVTATALTALNPQFLRVSATVSNDSLATALAGLAVLLALKWTAPPAPARSLPLGLPPREASLWGRSPAYFTHRHALFLGLVAGLALLAKLGGLTALALVGLVVVARLFVVGEIHQSPFTQVIRSLLLIGLAAALLTGWWFVRNYQLYGEWLATDTHLNLAGRADSSLAQVWDLRAEAERAYWATFGWGQIRPPEEIYQLLFLFSRIGLVGLAAALVVRLVQGERSGPIPLNLADVGFGRVGLLLAWATLNLILYLRWVMEVGSVSHTRLVFPAIAAISLLLALGWHALLPRRLGGWFSGLITCLLLALNVYSLGWLVGPAFTPAGRLSQRVSEPASGEVSTDETSFAHSPASSFANLTFVNRLRLTGGEVTIQNQALDAAKPTARAGDVVLVGVQWQTLAAMDKNYSVAAVLLAPDGRVLARRHTYPGLGLRPTRYLWPGDIFEDVYPIRLEEELAEPVVARVTVNLFDANSAGRAGLPALDPAGREVMPIIGQVKVAPRTWPQYRPAQPARVNFAGTIALIGYDLPVPAAGGGDLTLYWESLAPASQDYVVFLHLLDSAGNVVGQADGPPTANSYPTSWWSPGEVIADRRALSIPAGVTTLRLGLYHLDTGERLPVSESTLPAQDSSVEIDVR